MIIALTIAVVLLVLWNVALTFECITQKRAEALAIRKLASRLGTMETNFINHEMHVNDWGKVWDAIDIMKRDYNTEHQNFCERFHLAEAEIEHLRGLVERFESAYALRFGLSVQDVLHQKQVAKEQEQAYYAELPSKPGPLTAAVGRVVEYSQLYAGKEQG